jgi:phosphoribosylformylglycinamidine synthase
MFLAKVYVSLKPTVNDPQGLTIKGALHELGFGNVNSVRAGKYMEILVDEVEQAKVNEQLERMCHKILANPVIESFRFELEEVAP